MTAGEVNAAWSVTAGMQADFVAMSGDTNPLHTDALAARRTPFGRPAVHGLHLVLDAMERIVEVTGRQPTDVAATFRHPVGVDDDIATALTIGDGRDADVVDATLTTDVWVAADVTIRLGDLTPHEMPHGPPPHENPETLGPEDLTGRSGAIAVAAHAALATQRFPALAKSIGHTCLSELLSLTRLVGMHTPGEHSLFSSLDVTLAGGGGRDGLAYEVTRFDERFGLATIRVDGPNVAGSLRAFLRPKPIEPSIDTAPPLPGEFAGQRWLVVGGSRGLGATAVLLLDAGGADVRFTFRSGAADAAHLAGRTARATPAHLDVLDLAVDLDVDLDLAELTAGGWRPTHLAYFASPPIFDGVHGEYSPALEARFRAVYVTGFERLVARLDGLAGILWPSSEVVDGDVAGLAEYAAVKRDGEALCARLAEGGRHIHTPRFPRLRTDQTVSFVPVEYGDAPAEVLAALRATRDGAPG